MGCDTDFAMHYSLFIRKFSNAINPVLYAEVVFNERAALYCLDVSLDKVSCEMLPKLALVVLGPMVLLRDVDHTMTDNKIGTSSRKVSLKGVRS